MPYRQVYEPAPSNKSLPILEELPAGVMEDSLSLTIREARGRTADGVYRYFYFCRRCKGWIEGQANTYQVNTLAPHQLAGRSGTEYYCIRCGDEIGFMGMMS